MSDDTFTTKSALVRSSDKRNKLLFQVLRPYTTSLIRRLEADPLLINMSIPLAGKDMQALVEELHTIIYIHQLSNSTIFYIRLAISDPFSSYLKLQDALEYMPLGSVVVVEEFSTFQFFCYPYSSAIDRFNTLYEELILKRLKHEGSSVDRLNEAGFERIQVQQYPPIFLREENKQLVSLTLQSLATRALSANKITPTELNTLITSVKAFEKNASSMISLPGITYVYAIKSKKNKA